MLRTLSRRGLLLAVLLLGLCGPARAADREVIDQLGRPVTLPAEIHRVVALQHQTLDILVELGAADRLVGVLKSWPAQIPGLDKLSPGLETLPTPGDLTSVNIESLLALHPDVVFVTNYAPPAMIAQITQAGLAVVAVSLSKGEGIGQPRLNPTFADDDTAYAEGLREGVRLIAGIVGRQERGEALLKAAFDGRALVEGRVADIPASERKRLYMANPDLQTYGLGKYTGVIMARSGGINVAGAGGLRGWGRASMEDVLAWNPQVVFVQDRYAPVADQIRRDPAWAGVEAVREGRIFITPEYVKPWGYPLPEALALGEMWMASHLYPERFRDIDLPARVDAFYRTFYGHPYTGKY